MKLHGRVAVVTGAAIGTGRAIALALADAGAEVVVADIDEAGGRETVRRAARGRARFTPVDMTCADEMVELLRSEPVQILVNNAGGGGHIPPHYPEARPDQWGATMMLNLLGPMRATQEALAPMREAGGGAIVNIASTAGLGIAPYQSPEYGAAKAGLIRFTSTLTDLAPVRVNCLVPDWVATERVPEAEKATSPPLISLSTVVSATLQLLRDDTLSGRVLVLDRGQAPRLLQTESPLSP